MIEFAGLKEKFLKIKNAGWHKSIRKGSGGVETTFEHLLDIEENTLEFPDFEGIEIKTKRDNSKAYTDLFNYAPEGSHYHEIERLRDTYGHLDSKLKKYLVLNNSVWCGIKEPIGYKYYFTLKIDKEKKKVLLYVFDIHMNLLENEVYWDFDTLKEKLYRKLSYVALVNAKSKYIDNEEYFYYHSLTIYKLKSFDTFIELLEKGIICLKFKVGVFYHGDRIGQIHDHGTSFSIIDQNFSKLFDICEVIN